MWQKRTPLKRKPNQKRNNSLADPWSLVHYAVGMLLGWTMAPIAALVAMVAWEPFEILVLSPVLARVGIDFGYESWRNSVSDTFFDAAGIFVGYYLFTALATPPFHLF